MASLFVWSHICTAPRSMAPHSCYMLHGTYTSHLLACTYLASLHGGALSHDCAWRLTADTCMNSHSCDSAWRLTAVILHDTSQLLFLHNALQCSAISCGFPNHFAWRPTAAFFARHPTTGIDAMPHNGGLHGALQLVVA